MAREKSRDAISSILLTLDGGTEGVITLTTTIGLYVKQRIKLISTALNRADLEIKRVLSATQIKVGLAGSNINTFSDVSAFLVADGAALSADEQTKPKIKPTDYDRAVFAEEPIVANRSILVDQLGNYFTAGNPFHVQLSDGSVNIGTVNAELEVQLSHQDDTPDSGDVHDSVRIGGLGADEADVTTDNELLVRDTKSISGLLTKPHDEVTIAYRTSAPGNGEIDTVITRLASVIQDTLTFTYGAGNKLTNVIRT